MNSLGWWAASTVVGLIALFWLTGWAIVRAFGPVLKDEWRHKRRGARVLLPVIAVTWFLVVAYAASHMFDPVPQPQRQRTTVTVTVPQ